MNETVPKKDYATDWAVKMLKANFEKIAEQNNVPAEYWRGVTFDWAIFPTEGVDDTMVVKMYLRDPRVGMYSFSYLIRGQYIKEVRNRSDLNYDEQQTKLRTLVRNLAEGDQGYIDRPVDYIRVLP